MQLLPYEGQSPQKKFASSKTRPSLHTDPKTAKCRIEINKISQRLKAYAEGAPVRDDEVLRLLEDTRGQVIRLRVARQSLRKPNKPKRRRP